VEPTVNELYLRNACHPSDRLPGPIRCPSQSDYGIHAWVDPLVDGGGWSGCWSDLVPPDNRNYRTPDSAGADRRMGCLLCVLFAGHGDLHDGISPRTGHAASPNIYPHGEQPSGSSRGSVRDDDPRDAGAAWRASPHFSNNKATGMSLVEFDCVSKSYNGRSVLEDFSLVVEERERLVLLGPSGCGKTTLLRLLAGFIAPDSGRILLAGKQVSVEGKILRQPEDRQIGMVFQDLALWPHMTVRENIEFGLKARRLPAKEREGRVGEVLGLVQLEPFVSSKPSELSGGQQQRVALARALALHPRILLMDEPLSSLHYELVVELRGEILRLHEVIGFTLIYVTHNHDEAFAISSRVAVMNHGRIEALGAAEEIRELLGRITTGNPRHGVSP
jgi:iron(III) transport system ATP-binding protein